MSEITKLIGENKLDNIKELSNFDYKIQELLKDTLSDTLTREFEEINFEADKYQEEFIEGGKIFKALVKADLYMEAMTFSMVLVFLGFKTGEFIQLLSNTALNKGVNLSEISLFKIEPNLRNSMQEVYDLMDEDYLVPKANIAAAKTRISQAIFNKIPKYEFGKDMLQMGMSYEKIDEKEMATRVYQGIMNDFESESVKSNSGLFPEISQIENRSEKDIEIYNKAKKLFENITGTKVREPKRVNINDNETAKKIVVKVENQTKELKNPENSFLKKIKKWFS